MIERPAFLPPNTKNIARVVSHLTEILLTTTIVSVDSHPPDVLNADTDDDDPDMVVKLTHLRAMLASTVSREREKVRVTDTAISYKPATQS